ncbi:MAG: metalloregulator ArsR/SmtB family transcription factor [Archaeoglobaceae archaeon]|nr:metalloregulator ArsR/SmtB family transcription factor [Archaeoglobaceae archaeon]MDW8118763.1 metalloregulator ArsR/SmtB family transcription factor [Archaeoglobaceae archaeon]
MNVLDAIGNESRRRILELLAKKPCYLSEISYYLGMAPKLVIEHLEKLERAGIVKSVEDGRRRYYYISTNLRVEITISPHNFEISLQKNKSDGDPIEILKEAEERLWMMSSNLESLTEIYRAMKIAEDVRRRFSAVQSSITAKLNDMIEELLEEVERVAKDDLERLVLLGIAKGLRKTMEIAECFRIPYKEVEETLESLRRRGVVRNEQVDGENVWVIG